LYIHVHLAYRVLQFFAEINKWNWY